MANSNYSQVDEYGFERPEDFDYEKYDSFMSQYMRTLTRRALRWNSLFSTKIFVKNNTLKRFIRKGIPADFRPSCWMAVSGAEALRKSSISSYQQMKNNNSNAAIIECIKIDLPRTFPDNIFFLNEENLPNMLYNVLATFAHQSADVGYCQGLNYIAGLILLATKDESITFWLLKTLVDNMLPKYYIKTMSGLLTDLDVLNELVQKAEPVVHRHILNVGMPWAMGTTKWFICLYADVLPTETVLRIWDCLFFEGSKILFRVALALIKLHKQEILQTSDLSELMTVFKNMKNHPRVIDCHSFITDMFRLSGNLQKREIEKLRMKYKKD
ncbi:growth hormone-regulated TBC protein 1-A-like [Anthonomus grandis grandis]|uniref:growth hormone-regulated TBC protein 1-A-like n=1 Tax=Anthonomus grandis grandis TaxID=2921223 RepID=UPI0021655822|nr:growth hormone-regulated TBC protein 1-A-like [Anthonomus grandis grandis]